MYGYSQQGGQSVRRTVVNCAKPRGGTNGLRSHCAYVSPEEAKPGDLIFFQGTYNTTGASHVGIYVGNGMMIHCGDPVQYTSVQTSYWQSHFLAYGRIQ